MNLFKNYNMKYEIDNVIYSVEIIRKIRNKRTYIRIKDNNVIYVTTNTFVTNFQIKKLLKDYEQSIRRMIKAKEKENIWNNEFFYLGKKYNVIKTNTKDISFSDNNVYIGNINIDSFYKKEAKKIFEERLDYWYKSFTRKIPKPTLTIRKMTTRWGVCNTKDKKITLNLELIKHNTDCLDYVIVHELSHLIYADHSKNFWNLVEENYSNYKNIRKKMKNHEE